MFYNFLLVYILIFLGNFRVSGGGTAVNSNDRREYLSLVSIQRTKKVVKIRPDGNCLYRAIAHHYYGDQERHVQVRAEVVEGLKKHRRYFSNEKSGVFDEEWLKTVLGPNPTYNAYVKYTSTQQSHGDTGCLEVFQRMHNDFGYCVWSEVSRNEQFTERYPTMLR